jgi:hypothetical protein
VKPKPNGKHCKATVNCPSFAYTRMIMHQVGNIFLDITSSYISMKKRILVIVYAAALIFFLVLLLFQRESF